jgi:hypothetical protein
MSSASWRLWKNLQSHLFRRAPARKCKSRSWLPALEALEERNLLSDMIHIQTLVGSRDTIHVAAPVSLPTNDLIYDRFDGLIYASVPGSAGDLGNTITEIDPTTGTIGNSFLVGNEPGKLALSDDGQFLYVALTGAPSVARLSINASSVDMTFSVGSGSFGPMYAEDLQVAPGNPDVVAVAREFHGIIPRHAGVGIYVDGVQLPVTTPTHTGSNSIAFSATPDRLYGYNNETTEFGFRRMNVDYGSGVTTQDTTGWLIDGIATIKFDAGRVYSTSGRVIDPDPTAGPPQVVGTYAGTGFASSVVPDSSTDRTYFLSGNQLLVYRQHTFTLLESFTLPASGGSLIRWGDNGLGYRSGNQVYLITLIPDPATLVTNDLAYDPFNGLVYASVPGAAGDIGNTVTEINPVTGRIGRSFFVGSEPGKLALSDDGQFLYVGMGGAPIVARLNIPAGQVDLTFALGTGADAPMYAEDLQVAPGNPNAVAVAREFHGILPRHAGVGIYVDGVQLPVTTPSHTGSNSIAFSATPDRLYGYDNGTAEFAFRRMNVDYDSGVTTQDATGSLIDGFNVTIKFDAGRVYSTNGRVIDPDPITGPPQVVGTYAGTGLASSVVPDSSADRTYFLSGNQLLVYGQHTFTTPFESFPLPESGGSLIRWGDNGLAYHSGNQVYLITLIPDPGPPVPPGGGGPGPAAIPFGVGAPVNPLTLVNPLRAWSGLQAPNPEVAPRLPAIVMAPSQAVSFLIPVPMLLDEPLTAQEVLLLQPGHKGEQTAPWLSSADLNGLGLFGI